MRMLALGCLLAMAVGLAAFAQDELEGLDPLLKILVQNKVITMDQAKAVQAEYVKQKAKETTVLKEDIGNQVLNATGYAMGQRFDGVIGSVGAVKENDAGDAPAGEDTNEATIAFFGDGATSQGDVHEGMVFAAAFDAPVVFYRVGSSGGKSICLLLCDRWFENKRSGEDILRRDDWLIQFRPGGTEIIEEITDEGRWKNRILRGRPLHDLDFCMTLRSIHEILAHGRVLTSYEHYALTLLHTWRRVFGPTR